MNNIYKRNNIMDGWNELIGEYNQSIKRINESIKAVNKSHRNVNLWIPFITTFQFTFIYTIIVLALISIFL